MLAGKTLTAGTTTRPQCGIGDGRNTSKGKAACPAGQDGKALHLFGVVFLNVKQHNFWAQKSIADNDAAMP